MLRRQDTTGNFDACCGYCEYQPVLPLALQQRISGLARRLSRTGRKTTLTAMTSLVVKDVKQMALSLGLLDLCTSLSHGSALTMLRRGR